MLKISLFEVSINECWCWSPIAKSPTNSSLILTKGEQMSFLNTIQGLLSHFFKERNFHNSFVFVSIFI